MKATLTGTLKSPKMLIDAGPSDLMTNGRNALKWVENLPGARKDFRTRKWAVSATGPAEEPAKAFSSRGFKLGRDPEATELEGETGRSLWHPIVYRRADLAGSVLVYPRLWGYEATHAMLGFGAQWDKKRQAFTCSFGELHVRGDIKTGLVMSEATREAVLSSVKTEERTGRTLAVASYLAANDGHSEKTKRGLAVLESENKLTLPEWFGLDLYPYQRAGAFAAAAGHTLIADEPGLGKGSPASVRIATPTGWTTYGNVAPGDTVVASNGLPTTVTNVYPRGRLNVFKVKFDDLTSVIVDGDHLWPIDTGQPAIGRTRHVHSTKELAADLSSEQSGRHSFNVPLASTITFGPEASEDKDLPTTGGWYTLTRIHQHGQVNNDLIWLGQLDQAETNKIAADVDSFDVKVLTDAMTGDTYLHGGHYRYYALMDAAANGDLALDPFKLSIADRTSIIEAMVDSATHRRSPHTATWAPANLIAASLGGRVTVTPTTESSPAQYLLTLPEKLARKAGTPVAPGHRTITSVEPAGEEEVICISVAANDQLYVTENFILTHNTRQALAAVAISGGNRLIIVCPPVVITHWQRETSEAGIGKNFTLPAGTPVTLANGNVLTLSQETPITLADDSIVMIRPGRKEPELPETGVVIVADSTLAARAELRKRLVDWGADNLIYDEAHRSKTWLAARSTAMRSIAFSTKGKCFPLTGTPVLANPVEVASLLSITGHLDSVFGGFDEFCDTYARRDKFGGLHTKVKMIPDLRKLLERHVWVRRVKKQVLLDLPPRMRTAEIIDVAPTLYNAAHKEVVEKITEWATGFHEAEGTWPGAVNIQEYAKASIGLTSPLRKATGLSKVDYAITRITDWISATTTLHANGTFEANRPLLVWSHHNEVMDAMIAATPAALLPYIGVIRGGTPDKERDRIVDEYQAGRIAVIYCSITAAGVGLTLTRGSDALFVEVDWTPALVRQAEDRQWRIGQKNTVNITALIANDTLDGMIHTILSKKQVVLDELLKDGENNASYLEAMIANGTADDVTSAADIIELIATEVVTKLSTTKQKVKA